MKRLTWIGFLLSSGLAMSMTTACGDGTGDDTGDGDGDGDGDGTGGSGDGSGGSGDASGGSINGTGGSDDGTGGSDDGTGGSDDGTGGSDDGTGGNGGVIPSQACVDYCAMWFTKDCNAPVEESNEYADHAECQSRCMDFATDVAGCRTTHLGYATNQDATHCGHAAETPTENCVP